MISECPVDFIELSSESCYMMGPEGLAWEKAVEYCTDISGQHNGRLVEIDDDIKEEVVANIVREYNGQYST